MADTAAAKQGSNKGSHNSKRSTQLFNQLKQAIPNLTDERIREIIRQCNEDETQVNNWIDQHFDKKESAKDWSVVSKGGSKQANPKDKRDDKSASQSKLPARGTKGPGRNGTDAPREKPRANGITFAIPKSKHPSIIGPQGKTIQALQNETSARILVPNRDDRTAFVTLSGDPVAIETARQRLEQLLNFPLRSGDVGTLVLNITKKAHSAIIGKGGQALAELEKAHLCAIQFPAKNQDTEEVRVQGLRDSCQQLLDILTAQAAQEGGTVQVVSSSFDDIPVHETAPETAAAAPSTSAAPQQSYAQPLGNGTSEAIADVLGNIGAQLGLQVTPQQAIPSSALPQSQEDVKAAAIASEIIDNLISSGLSLNLQTRLQSMLLPTANLVQLHMRVRLHERVVAQRRKLQDMERQSQHDYVVFNQLEQDMRQKEKLLDQLREDMRQIQQRVTATESELQKTRKDHAAAKQIVDGASQSISGEKQQVELCEHALRKAEAAAQKITSDWNSWMKKLAQYNINDWSFTDMDTLLGCLGINPQFFSSNGIEPSMLACIDDSLLRELTWNNERLRFGERRHLLIALRAILNTQRKPLPEGSQASPLDVVTYLMSWGLNIQTPTQTVPKHAIAWSVEDVAAWFRNFGLDAAAEGCERERVCGAVLLTMYRKDCFTLDLPSLGDAIHMWKEASLLQRSVFGKNIPQNTGLWLLEETPVQRLTPEEVAKCFESRDLRDLAGLCRREKVSGVVVASVRRMEDIATVEFPSPGDRIRFLKFCEQLSMEYK